MKTYELTSIRRIQELILLKESNPELADLIDAELTAYGLSVGAPIDSQCRPPDSVDDQVDDDPFEVQVYWQVRAAK